MKNSWLRFLILALSQKPKKAEKKDLREKFPTARKCDAGDYNLVK